MISDGAGGFILVYNDRSSDNNGTGNLYAQRMSGTGTRLWQTGVALGNSNALYKEKLKLENDAANGMVATWNESDFSTGGVYAQRITNAGTKAWGNGGILVNGSLTPGTVSSTMAADGAGNYVITWVKYDNIFGLNVIKGQKINSNAVLQWAGGGVDICTNLLSFADAPVIVRSAGSTMLVVWGDSRNSATSKTDIYSARIESNGTLTNTAITNYVTAANGDWNSAASWTGNAVPPAGANVIIRHSITGNVNAVCNSVRVELPGTLTINTGINITVQQ